MSGLFGKMKIMICTAKSGDFIMDVLASFWWLGGPVESNTAFKTNRCARRGCAFLCISGLVRVLDFQFRQVKQKYNPMYKAAPYFIATGKIPLQPPLLLPISISLQESFLPIRKHNFITYCSSIISLLQLGWSFFNISQINIFLFVTSLLLKNYSFTFYCFFILPMAAYLLSCCLSSAL